VEFYIRHHYCGFYLPYRGSNHHAVKSAKVSKSLDHRQHEAAAAPEWLRFASRARGMLKNGRF